MNYFFDIETASETEENLEAVMPQFDAPGNVKDPVKIEKKIEEKKAAWIEKAALNPMTARVIAIGVFRLGFDKAVEIFHGEDEKEVLSGFMGFLEEYNHTEDRLIGFNTHLFDIRMMCLRAWKNEVKSPWWIMNPGLRYVHESSVDLRTVWAFGQQVTQCPGTLDQLASFLGIERRKNGSGKDFYRTYLKDKDKALAYLENDVLMVSDIYARLQPFVTNL